MSDTLLLSVTLPKSWHSWNCTIWIRFHMKALGLFSNNKSWLSGQRGKRGGRFQVPRGEAGGSRRWGWRPGLPGERRGKRGKGAWRNCRPLTIPKVNWGNTFLFHSSQQLAFLRLGPLKDFLSWHGALQGPSTCLVRCFRNYRETYKNTVRCTVLGAEVPGHRHEQLAQTLIVHL